MEGERERERSAEENDQLSRSNKQMKRLGDSNLGIEVVKGMDLGSPRALHTERDGQSPPGLGNAISYRDSLQRNNPNLTFEAHDNPIWMADIQDDVSDDDDPVEDVTLCVQPFS